MSRITRKELKKDEFATEVSKTYEFVQQQRVLLIRYGIAAAVALVLITGSYYLVQSRRERASEELAHAVRVFYAPTTADGAQPAEPDMNFANSRARNEQGEKEFSNVASKYSWLNAGLIARYYLGLTKQQLGKTDEAIRELKAVADKNDSRISPLARYALAGVYANTGRPDEAEKIYRDLADRATESVPRETALLSLADLLATRKPAEAEKILQDIKKQAPNRTAGEIADRRLAELKK